MKNYQFLSHSKLIGLHDSIGFLDTITPLDGIEYKVKENEVVNQRLSDLLNEISIINKRREEIKLELCKLSYDLIEKLNCKLVTKGEFLLRGYETDYIKENYIPIDSYGNDLKGYRISINYYFILQDNWLYVFDNEYDYNDKFEEIKNELNQ